MNRKQLINLVDLFGAAEHRLSKALACDDIKEISGKNPKFHFGVQRLEDARMMLTSFYNYLEEELEKSHATE